MVVVWPRRFRELQRRKWIKHNLRFYRQTFISTSNFTNKPTNMAKRDHKVVRVVKVKERRTEKKKIIVIMRICNLQLLVLIG